MKKVLVTGASGALAAAIIKRLKLQGDHVITSSRSKGSDCNITCDVRYKKQILNMLHSSDLDVIVHLAATFSDDFNEAYKVNVLPAQYMLEFLKNSKKKTRIVLIGSASEYGIVHSEENPISEDHILAPVTPYAISKAWQTQLMGMYAIAGVDAVCARIFNLYGEGIKNKLFAGYLQNQILEVLAGKQSKIIVSNLSSIRDYISTTEAAEQIASIINYGKTQNIYHVASGMPITMRDFAFKQLLLNGLDRNILEERKLFVNSGGIEVSIIFADMKKTEKLMSKSMEHL